LTDPGRSVHGALLVSAIIPAHNHGAYIDATLASVLAQRYPHVELIVIDDGSTDDTAQRVAKLCGRVTYHRQANRGMAAARNRGIALAQGQLVSFLDDDDLWEPDYLATVVPLFARDPDIAAVYTGYKSLDATGQILPQGGTRVVASEDLYEELIGGGFFPACCLTVRRDVLAEVGGLDETLRGNDDWDLLLQLARDRRVIGVAEPLAIHREHAGGLSSDYEHMLSDSLRVVAKHFGPEAGPPAAWPEQRRRAYAGAYHWAAVGHLLQGYMDLGSRRLNRAVQVYPPVAHRTSTWYDIACSYQSRGWRGHVSNLDLARSERLLDELMASIADPPNEPGRTRKAWRAAMEAAGAQALGLLAYQQSELKAARRCFGRAVGLKPRLLFDRGLIARYVKSLFGARLLAAARRLRWRGLDALHPSERSESIR
jgi:glycosyltransferase involved in cell wall biosynthesis